MRDTMDSEAEEHSAGLVAAHTPGTDAAPSADTTARAANSGVRFVTLPLDDHLCRALNIVVAAVGLVLSSPAILAIAIAVKLSSPGPVFFVQPRVGLDRRSGWDRRKGRRAAADRRRRGDTGGRLFRIYKFRTMTVAEPGKQEAWAGQETTRITGVGRVLRKYRLDELPQFINVLKGDMNIVGPRPEQPGIFAELRGEVEDYSKRQKVLPGITGWAQVNHGYDATIEDVRKKVDLDLQYIEGRSFRRDLWIMLKTLPVMIFKRGSM